MFPIASLDLGWEGVRFFSSHLEFLLEDWTAFGGGERRDVTHTEAGVKDGDWRLRSRTRAAGDTREDGRVVDRGELGDVRIEVVAVRRDDPDDTQVQRQDGDSP